MFLCRYLTIDKLMDFIINKRLFFSKPENFSDKLEFFPSLMLRSSNIHSYDDLHVGLHNNNQSKRKGLFDHKYVLCLREEDPTDISKGELLMMWDMYTNKSDLSIKIAFNKNKLIEYLESLFKLGKTKLYNDKVTYGNDDQDLNQEKLIFRKDINYIFENEYRFIAEITNENTNFFATSILNKLVTNPIDLEKFKWVKDKHRTLFENINNQQLQHGVNTVNKSEYGCYIPLDYIKQADLIDHVQFSPYCSELSKNNLRYLLKTFLFPQLSYTFGNGWSNDDNDTAENHNKIRPSTFDATVRNLFKNAVSPYDY